MALKPSIRSRKGVLFTLVTVIVFILISAEVLTYLQINYNYNALSAAASQQAAAASFAGEMRAGYAQALSQSLRSSLTGLQGYEANYLNIGIDVRNNTASLLQQLVYNSTVQGAPLASSSPSNILSYSQYLESIASSEGMNLTLSRPVLVVYQTAPFALNANLSINATITSGAASFTYPINVGATLNLSGTPDLYGLQSGYSQPLTAAQGPSASLVGNAYADEASTSPFMFAYGTMVVEPSLVQCSSIPANQQSGAFVLVTPDASNVNPNVCGMGGLVTYKLPVSTPLRPYLQYSSQSGALSSIANGMTLLLSGPSLSLLNLSGLAGAVSQELFIADPNAPSYLALASASTASSTAGIYSLSLLDAQPAQFSAASASHIDAGELLTLPSALTVSAWVYPTGTLASSEDIFSADEAQQDGYALKLDPGNRAEFDLWGTSGPLANAVTGANVLQLNQWNLVTGTFGSGSISIYVNGNPYGSNSAATQALPAYVQSTIGAENDAPSMDFSGMISNLQIYSSALPPAQLHALYAGGITGPPANYTSLFYWWPLNGDLGSPPGFAQPLQPYNVIFVPLRGYLGDSTTGAPLPGYRLFPTVALCQSPNGCTNSSYQNLYLPNNPTLPTAYFSGSSSSFSIPHGAGVSTANLTVTAWVRDLNTGAPRGEVLDLLDQNLSVQSGDACFYVNGVNTGSSYTCSQGAVSQGGWTFIAATLSGRTETVYLNGQPSRATTFASAPYPSAMQGSLGACASCSSPYYFTGYMTNVEAYNATLSQGELQAMYDEGIYGTPVSYNGLFAWFPLNGNGNDYAYGLYSAHGSGISYYTLPYDYSPDAETLNLQDSYLPTVMRFDGTGAAVVTNSLQLGASAISVSAWVYPTAVGAQEDILSSGGSLKLALDSTGSQEADFTLNLGGTKYTVSSPANSIHPNSWYFLTGTYSSTSGMELYLNAATPSTLAESGGVVQPSANTVLGNSNTLTKPFMGYLSDVRIYPSALSANQVTSLFLNDSAPGAQESYYWPLSGPAGSVLNVTPDVAAPAANAILISTTQPPLCQSVNVSLGLCGAEYEPG